MGLFRYYLDDKIEKPFKCNTNFFFISKILTLDITFL